MKKPRKSPLGILKIALLIPTVLITLGLTTGMTPQQKTVKGKVILTDTGKAATGASIVIRGGTVGTVVDIDGTFRLNVDGNPELVISYVGYKTFVVKASDIGNKPLKLEVEAVELDLESVPTATIEAAGSVSFKLKDGGEAQPVIVLDGKLMDGSIEDIDPNEILSIEVIKDPDDPMVKAYNAKDGLILITSKGAKVSAVKSGITIKSVDGSEGEPTYVVDGKVVKEIDNLDSESIESVSVFKDSDNEVVKKYNAKNGVVMITTKEGKEVLDETGSDDEEEVFYIVEDMPKFPGGKPALKTYIYSNLEYPEKAKNEGMEGEVQVRFLVNEKGEVVNSEVLQSSNKVFKAPALKVIQEMPDWTPGKQRGKAVKVWYVMSINFNEENL